MAVHLCAELDSSATDCDCHFRGWLHRRHLAALSQPQLQPRGASGRLGNGSYDYPMGCFHGGFPKNPGPEDPSLHVQPLGLGFEGRGRFPRLRWDLLFAHRGGQRQWKEYRDQESPRPEVTRPLNWPGGLGVPPKAALPAAHRHFCPPYPRLESVIMVPRPTPLFHSGEAPWSSAKNPLVPIFSRK